MSVFTYLPLNVSRRSLFAISGLLWCAIGALMCVRALFWTYNMPLDYFLIIEFIGIGIGIIGFRFGFYRITHRNIDRIKALPDRPPIFSFTGARGYIMILGMIVLGIFLRNSPIPKDYLAIPYNAMGTALMTGGFNFLVVFRKNNIRSVDPHFLK